MVTNLALPTANGEVYCIVAVDCFAKWVEMCLLKSKGATMLANWFYPHLVACFADDDADDARKLYHDAHQGLIDYKVAEGDLVSHQQKKIGKLLPKAEGPYESVHYTG